MHMHMYMSVTMPQDPFLVFRVAWFFRASWFFVFLGFPCFLVFRGFVFLGFSCFLVFRVKCRHQQQHIDLQPLVRLHLMFIGDGKAAANRDKGSVYCVSGPCPP